MSEADEHDETGAAIGGPGGGPGERGIELAPEQLSAAALRGLVEEFVTREGTDYGHGEWSLEQKVEQVLRQLDAGEIRIVFDLETESASLVPIEPKRRRRLGDRAAGEGPESD